MAHRRFARPMYGVSQHTRVANRRHAVVRKAKVRHTAQQHARATTTTAAAAATNTPVSLFPHERSRASCVETMFDTQTATSILALGYDFPSSRNVPDGGVHHAAARTAHCATETPLKAKNFVYSLLGEPFPSSRMDGIDPGLDPGLDRPSSSPPSSLSSSPTCTPRSGGSEHERIPTKRRAEVAREREAAASLAAGIAMTTLGKEQAIAAIRSSLSWDATVSGTNNATAHPMSANDYVKSGFEQMRWARLLQLPSSAPQGESEGSTERAPTATTTATAVPPRLSTGDYNRYTSTVEEVASKYLQMQASRQQQPLAPSPESSSAQPYSANVQRPARIGTSGRRGLSTRRTATTLELGGPGPAPPHRGAKKRHVWQPAQVASYGGVVELPANSSAQVRIAKSTGLPDRRFRKASGGSTLP